jgi:hypothetical protein
MTIMQGDRTMSAIAGFRNACMLAFLVSGQLQAQSTINPLPHGTISFDNILRVTKVQEKAHTADFEIEVQRLSDRAITAYGLNLSMRYADGRERKNAVGYDLIETIVPEVPGFSLGYSGLTQYGQYHSTTFNAPSDDANAPPVAVSATVAWVAFDDKTVSGSGGGLQMIEEVRKDESHYLADLLAELRNAEAHPDALAESVAASPGQPVFQNEPVLQKAIMGLKLKTPKGPQAGVRGCRSGDLDIFVVAAAVSTAKFDSMLERYTSLQALLADQCDLNMDK